MKYKRRPHHVEVTTFLAIEEGEPIFSETPKWLKDALRDQYVHPHPDWPHERLTLVTDPTTLPPRQVVVDLGDVIARMPDESLRVYTPDDFERNFEQVGD